MPINEVTKQIIKRCQKSPGYFLDSFGKIQHPKLGIIPFKLFSYQKKCLSDFLKNRFSIFKKTRQSGISTVTGGFALWYAMFFNQKNILIVSKRDDDAMEFLRRNIKTIHDNLPDWMRALWPRIVDNEHEIGFPNGSRIKSLTSSKDTLRSQSASLNIIDESAFIPDMDTMWKAGASTLQHGGSCIVISTVSGIGNWYWQTWTDAEAKANDFHPIIINWWDMDWRFEFDDELSGKKMTIAPTDGIRPCVDALEIEKYGQYWSPWLEDQYRQLTQKGDSSKFRQEVLGMFLGSGNTVLSVPTLTYSQTTIDNQYKTITQVDYVNPNTEERAVLDFENSLWVWNTPEKGHLYALGADTSSGEAHDHSTIEIFDVTNQEQVAELQIKTAPRTFAQMIDYLGRWYFHAFAVVERTGLGITVCKDLSEELMYQNLYRRPRKNAYNKDNKYGDVGWNTSVTSKPILNKALIDNTGSDGWAIKSSRLYKELSMYVHLRGNRTGAEPGKGNNDDLVIATALAFIGAENLNAQNTSDVLMPIRIMEMPQLNDPSIMQRLSAEMSKGVLLPMTLNTSTQSPMTIGQELGRFMRQLGGLTAGANGLIKPVNLQKHTIKYRRK